MSEGARIEPLHARYALLLLLRERQYHFTTPTPATHARVVARKTIARDLRDMFGWSLPFAAEIAGPKIMDAMEAGGVLERRGDVFVSNVRVSSLDDLLFLHSAYPTTQHDAVFFGPDSYRFAAFLKAELPRLGRREGIADIGAGSGVGGIVAARIARPQNTQFIDINPLALEFAMANAWLAGNFGASIFTKGDGLVSISETIDTIIANPPYIIDPAHRAYRDGGGMHGAEISLAWAKAAAEKLATGGGLLLYTGSAIVNGEDRFKAALQETLPDFDITYREIDPDVFGEELEREDYADVDRIAVVGVVAIKR